MWPPPAMSPPPRPRRTAWLIGAVAAGLVLMLAVAVTVALAARAASPPAQAQRSLGTGTRAPASGGSTVDSAQVAAVAAKVDPGLVDINTVLGYQNGAAAGTGIVLSADGLVLTNNHVVAGATSINVTDVGNGRTYSATVVGYDRGEDVAVVRLAGASGLTVAPLGDSTGVGVGDTVVALGNAGGTGGTPAAVGGTVTGLDRSITAQDESSGAAEQLTGLIEVAAAIQPGDSGGALATASGQVVGMNTAASAGFRYQASGGDGFAIPINQATTIAKQIGSAQSSNTVHIGGTAFLGVQTGGDTRNAAGAPVLGVVSGSPAEAAGLSRGAVITSVGGQAVDSPTTLTTLLDRYHPGDRVGVGWIDAAGQEQSATVALVAGPVG
jgi:S1-C subfamily serine protease